LAPYEASGAFALFADDERAEAGPHAEQVAAMDLDIGPEVAPDLVEQPAHVLVGAKVGLHAGVRRPRDRVPLPCQGKKKTTRPSDVAMSSRPIERGLS
jgi:hypothetical protein